MITSGHDADEAAAKLAVHSHRTTGETIPREGKASAEASGDIPYVTLVSKELVTIASSKKQASSAPNLTGRGAVLSPVE